MKWFDIFLQRPYYEAYFESNPSPYVLGLWGEDHRMALERGLIAISSLPFHIDWMNDISHCHSVNSHNIHDNSWVASWCYDQMNTTPSCIVVFVSWDNIFKSPLDSLEKTLAEMTTLLNPLLQTMECDILVLLFCSPEGLLRSGFLNSREANDSISRYKVNRIIWQLVEKSLDDPLTNSTVIQLITNYSRQFHNSLSLHYESLEAKYKTEDKVLFLFRAGWHRLVYQGITAARSFFEQAYNILKSEKPSFTNPFGKHILTMICLWHTIQFDSDQVPSESFMLLVENQLSRWMEGLREFSREKFEGFSFSDTILMRVYHYLFSAKLYDLTLVKWGHIFRNEKSLSMCVRGYWGEINFLKAENLIFAKKLIDKHQSCFKELISSDKLKALENSSETPRNWIIGDEYFSSYISFNAVSKFSDTSDILYQVQNILEHTSEIWNDKLLPFLLNKYVTLYEAMDEIEMSFGILCRLSKLSVTNKQGVLQSIIHEKLLSLCGDLLNKYFKENTVKYFFTNEELFISENIILMQKKDSLLRLIANPFVSSVEAAHYCNILSQILCNESPKAEIVINTSRMGLNEEVGKLFDCDFYFHSFYTLQDSEETQFTLQIRTTSSISLELSDITLNFCKVTEFSPFDSNGSNEFSVSTEFFFENLSVVKCGGGTVKRFFPFIFTSRQRFSCVGLVVCRIVSFRLCLPAGDATLSYNILIDDDDLYSTAALSFQQRRSQDDIHQSYIRVVQDIPSVSLKQPNTCLDVLEGDVKVPFSLELKGSSKDFSNGILLIPYQEGWFDFTLLSQEVVIISDTSHYEDFAPSGFKLFAIRFIVPQDSDYSIIEKKANFFLRSSQTRFGELVLALRWIVVNNDLVSLSGTLGSISLHFLSSISAYFQLQKGSPVHFQNSDDRLLLIPSHSNSLYMTDDIYESNNNSLGEESSCKSNFLENSSLDVGILKLHESRFSSTIEPSVLRMEYNLLEPNQKKELMISKFKQRPFEINHSDTFFLTAKLRNTTTTALIVKSIQFLFYDVDWMIIYDSISLFSFPLLLNPSEEIVCTALISPEKVSPSKFEAAQSLGSLLLLISREEESSFFKLHSFLPFITIQKALVTPSLYITSTCMVGDPNILLVKLKNHTTDLAPCLLKVNGDPDIVIKEGPLCVNFAIPPHESWTCEITLVFLKAGVISLPSIYCEASGQILLKENENYSIYVHPRSEHIDLIGEKLY